MYTNQDIGNASPQHCGSLAHKISGVQIKRSLHRSAQARFVDSIRFILRKLMLNVK